MEQSTYQLRTNFNEYANDELDVTLFKEILNDFRSDVWDFMVLSPDKPIKDSTFIQVGAPQKIVDYQLTMEIGFYTKSNGLTVYRSYTNDTNLVLQHFIDYWTKQQLPDISSWSDVSHEFRR